jgi:GTP-binding protein
LISPRPAAIRPPRSTWVDLPGYGYAKVPQELQAHWQAFIESYFATRQALRGLVVVMDIRHPLKDYDRQMLGYAVRRDLPAHVLLTKADKLSRARPATPCRPCGWSCRAPTATR